MIDFDKPMAGCESFCEDCKSVYVTSDYDGAEGTYQLENNCDDYEDCAEFVNCLAQYQIEKGVELSGGA